MPIDWTLLESGSLTHCRPNWVDVLSEAIVISDQDVGHFRRTIRQDRLPVLREPV